MRKEPSLLGKESTKVNSSPTDQQRGARKRGFKTRTVYDSEKGVRDIQEQA